MPIYAYRCTGCGFEKDVMQKVSEAKLTVCPACKAESFAKQLTAPGFHLKGTGWYATDFKGGSKPVTATNAEKSAEKSAETGGEGKTDAKAEAKVDAATTDSKSTPAPAPAAAPTSTVSTTPSSS